MKTFENVKAVTTLKGLEVNKMYLVENAAECDFIKRTTGNRGGVEISRLNQFTEKMKNGSFYDPFGAIFVGTDGKIGDGTHRFEAAKRLERHIIFMLVEPIDIKKIADLNSCKNTKWSPSAQFKSAVEMGYLLAIHFDRLISDYVKTYEKKTEDNGKEIIYKSLKPSQFTSSELFSILNKDVKYMGNGKHAPKVSDFDNKNLYKKSKSNKFLNIVDQYAEFKELYSNNGTQRSYKVSKIVLSLLFDKKVDFNFAQFISFSRISGYNTATPDKVDEIYAEVKRIHNLGSNKI